GRPAPHGAGSHRHDRQRSRSSNRDSRKPIATKPNNRSLESAISDCGQEFLSELAANNVERSREQRPPDRESGTGSNDRSGTGTAYDRYGRARRAGGRDRNSSKRWRFIRNMARLGCPERGANF